MLVRGGVIHIVACAFCSYPSSRPISSSVSLNATDSLTLSFLTGLGRATPREDAVVKIVLLESARCAAV
jgi:hypothetical protein